MLRKLLESSPDSKRTKESDYAIYDDDWFLCDLSSSTEKIVPVDPSERPRMEPPEQPLELTVLSKVQPSYGLSVNTADSFYPPVYGSVIPAQSDLLMDYNLNYLSQCSVSAAAGQLLPHKIWPQYCANINSGLPPPSTTEIISGTSAFSASDENKLEIIRSTDRTTSNNSAATSKPGDNFGQMDAGTSTSCVSVIKSPQHSSDLSPKKKHNNGSTAIGSRKSSSTSGSESPTKKRTPASQTVYTETFRKIAEMPADLTTSPKVYRPRPRNGASQRSKSPREASSEPRDSSGSGGEESSGGSDCTPVMCLSCKHVYPNRRSLTGHIGRSEKCRETIGRNYLDHLSQMAGDNSDPTTATSEVASPICPHCDRFISQYKGNLRRHINQCRRLRDVSSFRHGATEPPRDTTDGDRKPDLLDNHEKWSDADNGSGAVRSTTAEDDSFEGERLRYQERRCLTDINDNKISSSHNNEEEARLLLALQSGSGDVNRQHVYTYGDIKISDASFIGGAGGYSDGGGISSNINEQFMVVPGGSGLPAVSSTPPSATAPGSVSAKSQGGGSAENAADPYMCTWCQFSTVYKGNMKRHLISCHSGITDDLLRQLSFDVDRLRRSSTNRPAIDELPVQPKTPRQTSTSSTNGGASSSSGGGTAHAANNGGDRSRSVNSAQASTMDGSENGSGTTHAGKKRSSAALNADGTTRGRPRKSAKSEKSKGRSGGTAAANGNTRCDSQMSAGGDVSNEAGSLHARFSGNSNGPSASSSPALLHQPPQQQPQLSANPLMNPFMHHQPLPPHQLPPHHLVHQQQQQHHQHQHLHSAFPPGGGGQPFPPQPPLPHQQLFMMVNPSSGGGMPPQHVFVSSGADQQQHLVPQLPPHLQHLQQNGGAPPPGMFLPVPPPQSYQPHLQQLGGNGGMLPPPHHFQLPPNFHSLAAPPQQFSAFKPPSLKDDTQPPTVMVCGNDGGGGGGLPAYSNGNNVDL